MPHDLSWDDYNAHQTGREPRPLLRLAIETYEALHDARLDAPSTRAGSTRVAIDLGCGEGVEVSALLDAGWTVHAVDGERAALDRLAARTTTPARERLHLRPTTFAGLGPLPPADLVHSSYALPYCAPEDFARLWATARDALSPGGVLAVQLFGDRDGAAGDPEMTFHTAQEARALVEGLEVVHWDEEDAPGPSYTGPKHWHVFHVVARRPALLSARTTSAPVGHP